MRPKIFLLDQPLLERIVQEAFDVLSRVGVSVENQQAAALLQDAGCPMHNQRLLFPQTLVERALYSAPSSIQIYDRSGSLSMDLSDDHIHFDPGSSALRILDWPAEQERKPTTADIVRLARLTDGLVHLAAQSTGLVCVDVPQQIVDRYRLYIALLHSAKPIVTGTFTIAGFKYMYEMLVAVRGSVEALRRKPLAIFDCCPSPPLKWSNVTCQALLDCSRAGIPVELVSMPLAGATAPATLAGSLVQHTAETLSGVVISQLAAAGAPIIYGGSPVAMDPRTGTTPMGAIETMMIECGYVQIGKYFNLPTHAYMALTDAKVLDAQSGLEAATGAVLAGLAGVNVISGPGMMDFENCLSLEKLIIDHELCGMIHRLVQGIEPRGELLSADLYGDLQAGDHFFVSETTLKYLRQEMLVPSDVIDRDPYEVRQRKAERTIGERAHRAVKERLQRPLSDPLPAVLAEELHQIMSSQALQAGLTSLPDSSWS